MRHACLAMLVLMVFATGCATVTVDQSAVKKVRRIAIIGFNGKISSDGPFTSKLMQSFNDQEFAPKVYKVAQNQLAKSFHWTVVPAEEIKKNAAYRKITEQKSSQFARLLDRTSFAILQPGLLNSMSAVGAVSDLKFREKLMQKLGVDALMALEFNITPQQLQLSPLKSLMKAASPAEVSLYNCTVTLHVFNKNKKDPIWEKIGVKGENADAPTLKIFGITFSNMRQAAVVSSFTKAIETAIVEVKEH
jgi:hypothetical protein